jgi:hypothetical protein
MSAVRRVASSSLEGRMIPALNSSAAGVYWFRVPDDEAILMALRPAELKCYLVVARAIQRDRNKGKLSVSQLAARADLSRHHAHKAVNRLVDLGILLCDGKTGTTAVYRLPVQWRTGLPLGEPSSEQNAHKRPPVGERSPTESVSEGERLRSPVGAQTRTPVGGEHLESSKRKKIQGKDSLPVLVSRERQHHRDDAAVENPSAKTNPRSEFVRSVEAAASFRLSRGDLVYCADLERSGLDAETVCAGVLLGRARKLDSNVRRGISDPIRSLRYFDACIEEAKSLPAGYVDYLRKFVSRHGSNVSTAVEEQQRAAG